MATAELDFKGIRAYALYATAHLLPGFVLEHFVRYGLQSALLASLVGALTWGFALLRLAVRFYRGQGRILSVVEVRGIAFNTAWRTSAAMALLTLLWPGYEVTELLPAALLTLVLFVMNFVVNLLVLAVFLLPVVQERLFESWSRRNP